MKIITILSHITFLLQNMLWNGTNTISPLLYATFLCWYLLLYSSYICKCMYVVMCECIMLFVCLHLGQMCECMSNFKCCYKNTCLYEWGWISRKLWLVMWWWWRRGLLWYAKTFPLHYDSDFLLSLFVVFLFSFRKVEFHFSLDVFFLFSFCMS